MGSEPEVDIRDSLQTGGRVQKEEQGGTFLGRGAWGNHVQGGRQVAKEMERLEAKNERPRTMARSASNASSWVEMIRNGETAIDAKEVNKCSSEPYARWNSTPNGAATGGS